MYIDWKYREVSLKIVYYGPALSGKSSSLQALHRDVYQLTRGDYLFLAAVDNPALLYDFFAVELGTIHGKKVVFNLYGVLGNASYASERRLALNGVDGVVFVADSRPSQLEDNEISLNELINNLRKLGYEPADFPMVFQFNKRDLVDALPIHKLQKSLNRIGAPYFETVATQGLGLGMAFHAIAERVSAEVIRQLPKC
jgi:signal recognition particle receptor subunit beta